MKRVCFYLLAFAALALSCAKQETAIEDPAPVNSVSEDVSGDGRQPAVVEVSEGRVITVSPIVTKTAINEKDEGGYSFTWKAGDAIELFEFVYENKGSEDDNASPGTTFYSEALGQDTATATFTVDLNSTLSNPGGGKYRYVAVFPYSADYYWSDEEYYAGTWSDADNTLPVHPVIGLQFPTSQCPTATSFDPQADFLVSKVAALDSRADGNISLYYSRVGGVVKMTLTGLPANAQINSGNLSVDADFPIMEPFEYDVELEEVRAYIPSSSGGGVVVGPPVEGGGVIGPDWVSPLQIYPNDVYADAEGKADIWLRLPAGKIDEKLELSLEVTDYDPVNDSYGEAHSYVKSVDLAALGRSITFANGRMTTFSVAMEKAPEMQLSYTYIDSQGEERTNSSTSGLSIDPYFSPDAGTITLDVDYTGDISAVTVDDSNCDWATASFDPVTRKITLQYEANPTYETSYASSYGIGTRYGSIAVSAGNIIQYVYISQFKRDFRNIGETWTAYMPWFGGDDSSEIVCNFTPDVSCDDPSVSWTVERFQNQNSLWCTRIKVTAAPLEVTESVVDADVVISDPLNSSKSLTIRVKRFKKLAPGKYWVVSEGEDSWYSVYAQRLVDGEEYLSSYTFSLETSEHPTAAKMITPNSQGLLGSLFHFEPIEGSNKYHIYVSFGLDTDGKEIKRYLRKGSNMTMLNQLIAYNQFGLARLNPLEPDTWCEWDVFYVDDVIHVVCDADSNGDTNKVGVLCMGDASYTGTSAGGCLIGCFPGSSLNYRYSFDYYGIAGGSDLMRLYEIVLVPFDENVEPLPVAVTGVSMDQTEVAIDPGETVQLSAVVTPEDAADKSVTWTSSKTTVATVDANGLVTAKKPGEAVITVTTTDGSFTATCTVTVNPIPVTGVELNKTTATLKVGEELYLSAKVQPEDASNKNVTFEVITGRDVIEKEETGMMYAQWFKAVKAGQAYIQATTADGNFTATCHVTVEEDVKVEEIRLEPTSLTLDPGKTADYYNGFEATTRPYTYKVYPANAANQNMTVSSSDENIVTVSNQYSFLQGKYYTITAVAPGTASITFAAEDGSGISTVLPVTVNAPTAVESIALSITENTVYEGEAFTLYPIFTPSNATNQQVSWSSSNPDVATVDDYGQVTAESAGTAVITVTSADGNFTATCTVTVTQLVLDTEGPVDMGSGLLWASCNTGATSPEIYGTFTNWADIVPNEGWQTPTRAQFDDLLAECIHSILIYNGVKGLLLTSTVNGNHLFFPMTGATNTEYNMTMGEGYYVMLWTATEDGSDVAYVAQYDGQTFRTTTAPKVSILCPMRAVKQL
ncbi:MAG: Ig domain-containing protein [Bacteroidales bacterium]|nr:Ig domain-containing protein [Bacteroidales bacterium]